MSEKTKKAEKRAKLLIRAACILIGCWLLYKIVLVGFILFGLVKTDVVKRIHSPNGTMTSLLIRRCDGIDLGFSVKLRKKDDFFAKTIHSSRDFAQDLSVDWNETLIWSYDSSFLIMSIDNEFDSFEKYMWAYDFKDNKEYIDETEIMELLNSRNEGVENPAEARYR